MALSLLHGGSGFPYLAKSTYQYLCGVPVPSISVEVNEIASYDIQVLLDKVFFTITLKLSMVYKISLFSKLQICFQLCLLPV